MKNIFPATMKITRLIWALTVICFFASCDKESDPKPEPPAGINEPILLECDYFHEDRILVDDTLAPVDYIIPCELAVKGDLVVEPGVVIEFEQNAGMAIDEGASVQMKGTADNPILLTGVTKSKGSWKGVATWSTHPDNMMEYVTIDYAGSGSIQHGEVAGLCIFADGNITLNYSTISNSAAYGLTIFSPSQTNDNNIVLHNNTFTENEGPCKIMAGFINIINASNVFSGNVNDVMYIYGDDIEGDATWPLIDVPYKLDGDETKVSDGVLTIEPGVEIIMAPENEITINHDAGLVMVGTSSQKIIIRGEKDVPGYWNHIFIASKNVLNEIAFTDIRNAGHVTGHPNGAVWLGYSKYLNIHDVIFSNCFEYGVSLDGRAGQPLYSLTYANLSLDNTPELFSDWKGVTVIP